MTAFPEPRHRHSEWHDLAREKIAAMVAERHALLLTETVARLSPESGPYWNSGQALEAHIVTQTIDEMLYDGILTKTSELSRGGRPVEVIVPTQQKGIVTAVSRASSHKRSLYATYESWAIGNANRPHGRLGPAGELVAAESIKASDLILPLPTEHRTQYKGHTFSGPLDWIGVTTDDNHTTAAVVLVEVKNVRQWLYPQHAEVFQLLSKAAHLQRRFPTLHIVPILICRRANRRIFAMAKHLGFYTLAVGRQPVGHLDDENTERLHKVRTGLGFHDLTTKPGPYKKIKDRISGMHPYWPDAADRWKATSQSEAAVGLIDILSDKRTTVVERATARRALGEVANEICSVPEEMMWWQI